MVASEDITRTILVERIGGVFTKIDNIPADAKVTFGGVNPAAVGYNKSWALRIYTSKDNQLAVITDVVSFRDMKLTFSERKRKVTQKTHQEQGYASITVASDYEDAFGDWEPLTD